ncbi:hypothetical protein C8R42DRAFT_726209 [Lentinula raphanica]|nr:hypothetical protein C8R42DRAFT_726209 [Lentinula raphanica]
MSASTNSNFTRRRYVESDFYDGKKKFMRKDFVALICKQTHLWPSTLKKFDHHKTSILDMKNALLSTDSQFRVEDIVLDIGPPIHAYGEALVLNVSVTDHRLQSLPSIHLGTLRLPIADDHGCNENTRRVLTSTLLTSLQQSNAAISGCDLVCITRPDVPRSSHEYLVASAFLPSTLNQSDFALRYITVPLSGVLYLNVTNSITDPNDQLRTKAAFFVKSSSGLTPINRAEFSPAQESCIASIESQLGRDKVIAHNWTWGYKAKQADWIPSYSFAKDISRREIWNEFAFGINGQLSVQQLEGRWDTSWHFGDQGKRTELCRRLRLFELVSTLKDRPNWGVDLVFEFLDSTYPITPNKDPDMVHLQTTSNFLRWLQSPKVKVEQFKMLRDAAGFYCSNR